MTLGQKQELFMELLIQLLTFIREDGKVHDYKMRGGDLFRDPRVHGEVGVKKGYGHAKSAHKNKLAIDINLVRKGKLLTKTSDHAAIGAYWESLHPLCRWGGRFNDGNHYSLEHDGIM